MWWRAAWLARRRDRGVGDRGRLLLRAYRSTMVWQTRITRADGRLAAMVTQTQLVMPGRRKAD